MLESSEKGAAKATLADGTAPQAKSRYHKRHFAALPRTPMTENDYYIAWGLYAFAALGCLLVWFRLTRWLWRWLREPLRVIAAAAVFTPTVVDPAREQFAPALAITALDLLFKVAGNAWRAISDLAMYTVIALAVYVLFALIRWPLERGARARRAEAAAHAKRQAEAQAAG